MRSITIATKSRQPVARRSYRSQLRSEQAAATRRRVLEAAAECFSDKGYTLTTTVDIARRAEVSVETVKGCGVKRDLLLASFEQTFVGDETGVSLSSRPELGQLLALDDPEEMVSASVALITELHARASTLWRAFNSAADSDPTIRSALDEILGRRQSDIENTIRIIQKRGLIKSGPAARAKAAAAASFLLSPEGYDQLVIRAGWTRRTYNQWLTHAIKATILGS